MKKLLKMFSWLRLLYSINGTVMGLILGVFGNYLSGSASLVSLRYLFPAFIIIGAITFALEARRHKLFNVVLKVTTARTDSEKQRSARKGVITFVSIYNPHSSSIARKLTQDEIIAAVHNKDYRLLDLENTNFKTVIGAVCTHKDAPIKHCWLVGTVDAEGRAGSTMYQDMLVEYLRIEKKINCEFHFGADYAISIDDDALICDKTYNMIQRIYHEAATFGLDGKDIIADFTGGMRSMPAGMILACLHRDNDIQLMGTKYNGIAEPVGPLFPIQIAFEPEIKIQN